MKHQSLVNFKKSLEAAFPNNLSQIYFVIIEDDFERLRTIDFITRYLPHDGAYALFKKSAASLKVSQLVQELDGPSLLASRFCLIVDEIELYKKAEAQKLSDYLQKSTLFNYLILAARQKKELLTLLNEVDRKGGSILDLSFESLLDKQKRLSAFIVEKCAQAKKQIKKEALELFLSKTGLEAALIENELEKVINFSYGRPEIGEEEVEAVVKEQSQSTSWQMAEKLVWEGKADWEKLPLDAVLFHTLLPAIRYNLQEGYKLASFLEQKPAFDARACFPYIKPQVLARRKEKALQWGPDFFKTGLKVLFKIDLLSKNNVSDYSALLAFFQTQLRLYAADCSA
ncbi:MAG: hypothetical protein WC371_04980 [Parachlamydiales bacterium]|jgi:DNA polymerase-3 subunit delta